MKTTHNLQLILGPFLPELAPLTDSVRRYRLGTCQGIFMITDDAINIIAVENDCPGNGHLIDVFEYFEDAATIVKIKLRICQVWNARFKAYCMRERGFLQDENPDDIYKDFTKKAAGNESGGQPL